MNKQKGDILACFDEFGYNQDAYIYKEDLVHILGNLTTEDEFGSPKNPDIIAILPQSEKVFFHFNV